jgi:hypothetical protein
MTDQLLDSVMNRMDMEDSMDEDKCHFYFIRANIEYLNTDVIGGYIWGAQSQSLSQNMHRRVLYREPEKDPYLFCHQKCWPSFN